MEIEYDPTTCKITITDEERAKWRNGVDIFWKLPKDGNGVEKERPDWNLYSCDGFDDNDQALYLLDEAAHSFPVNKTPKNIEEVLENAKKISKLYHDYMRHALAVCLDPENKFD